MQEERAKESLIQQLRHLETEHSELDLIAYDIKRKLDEITLQRIKKRKLFLKDKISEIKSILYPKIIA